MQQQPEDIEVVLTDSVLQQPVKGDATVADVLTNVLNQIEAEEAL